jgi:hypothetical protein
VTSLSSNASNRWPDANPYSPLFGLVLAPIEDRHLCGLCSLQTSFIRRSAGRDDDMVLSVLSRAMAESLGSNKPGKILLEALQDVPQGMHFFFDGPER